MPWRSHRLAPMHTPEELRDAIHASEAEHEAEMVRIDRLAEQVVDALADGPMSHAELAAHVGADVEDIGRACDVLRRTGKLRPNGFYDYHCTAYG